MAFDGTEQGVLLGRREAAEALGEGGTDTARSEHLLSADAQAAADEEPALDPRAAFAETAGDLGDPEPILVGERAEHPRLVEGGEGTGWPIGGEDESLVLGTVAGRLDHHGELPRSALSGESQSLEAVDDLEATVVEWRDADR